MPRPVERIHNICSLLEKLWNINNKLSFGDLLSIHLFEKQLKSPSGDIWFTEDSKLESMLKLTLEDKSNVTSLVDNLSEQQKDLLSNLKVAWSIESDERLGQFLSNYVVGHYTSCEPGKMLNISDDTYLTGLIRMVYSRL